jgi:hypothetical protein
MPDLGPGVVVAVVAIAVALVKIFRGPIGEAMGDRLRGPVSSTDPVLLTELEGLRTRLADLEERLDFSERLLANGREANQLPGRAHR